MVLSYSSVVLSSFRAIAGMGYFKASRRAVIFSNSVRLSCSRRHRLRMLLVQS